MSNLHIPICHGWSDDTFALDVCGPVVKSILFLYHHFFVVWSTQSSSRKICIWMAFAPDFCVFRCSRLLETSCYDVNCIQRGPGFDVTGSGFSWSLDASLLLAWCWCIVSLRLQANPSCHVVPCLAWSWLVACVISVAFALVPIHIVYYGRWHDHEMLGIYVAFVRALSLVSTLGWTRNMRQRKQHASSVTWKAPVFLLMLCISVLIYVIGFVPHFFYR